MNAVSQLVRENMHVLDQALTLVGQTVDDIYCNNDSPLFMSGVGMHVRHILDFYTCFLNGLRAGQQVDYDNRQRVPEVETNRGVAVARIESLQRALADLDTRDLALQVKNDDGGGRPDLFTPSSITRELQFLLSHTVHHFAIVAMILRIQGVTPPGDGFGVAPSTLLYLQQTASQS